MKYAALFTIIAALVAVPKHHKKPQPEVVIVSQSTVHPSARDDNNPLMPEATLSHLVIENRSFQAKTATILCGEDEAEIKLSPRTRFIVDIEETLYVPDMKCEVKSVQ